MATVAPTRPGLPADNLGGLNKNGVWRWVLAADDVGEPIKAHMFPDRTVQVFGTFGGATVTFQGSLGEGSYATLVDQSDNFLSFTSGPKIEAIAPNTVWVRPFVTGGDGTTSITVLLLAGGNKS